jgi:hypothetical protein
MEKAHSACCPPRKEGVSVSVKIEKYDGKTKVDVVDGKSRGRKLGTRLM